MSESGHVRKLARQMESRAIAAETAKLLDISPGSDGWFYGRCRSCPKKTRDIRGQGNRAFSSSHRERTAELIHVWFDAHRQTEMHAYYRDDPPMQHPSEADLQIARALGSQLPKPRPVPFLHAKRVGR
jgi:hypothetical protein